MGLFSRRIVGWAMDVNMEAELTLTALQRAVKARNPPPGLIHHSDRGSQYASGPYQAALKKYGMICSMSGKGECWDNAPAESVFGRLKEELIYRTQWESRAQVVAAVDEYLQRFYNSKRLHSSLDFCRPVDYELRAAERQSKFWSNPSIFWGQNHFACSSGSVADLFAKPMVSREPGGVFKFRTEPRKFSSGRMHGAKKRLLVVRGGR